MTSSARPPIRPALSVTVVEWDHPDAVTLRDEMAAEVGPRYAYLAESLRGNTPNAVDPATVHRTFVVYSAEPVGHATLRWNGDDLELKRMFVRPAHRGSGAASLLLTAAEDAARAAGRPRLILQTGHLQPEAVRFYERSGYHRIPLFPPYEVLPLSNCFAKPV
ncbi:GNAT family N-acetyltransferase [Nocardia bovistercoris]|uniref:GNAT family N-acetyltransferase n=1 Tax=Nocardia bovistercoris TaxID=2785916 RepID=A0A931I9H5_9NOCA|nr:GNAT family N-acetyltransferase [Nocardia bovistercoris]MBH0777189.1 GNAT family N-acetyltransferase [Nocardia bovistercoris]